MVKWTTARPALAAASIALPVALEIEEAAVFAAMMRSAVSRAREIPSP
jgi:hypothetical protein